MLSGQAPGHNNLSFTNQTATMPPPPILSTSPFAFTHWSALKPHIPKAQRASKAFSSGTLSQSHFTHKGHSSSLVLHHCRLFSPCTHGTDTSPQAMRLINYSEFQRAAAPLGLEKAPLYSTRHQQEAATLQPADTQDYYPHALKVILTTKWRTRLRI